MEHGTQSKDKAKEAWYAKDLLIEILQEQMNKSLVEASENAEEEVRCLKVIF